MNILIFGASGKIGSRLVKVLLDRGHTVTVFVHTSGSFIESDNLHIKRGDIHDQQSVENAILNQDIIVSTLGSWGTKQKDILSTAMKHIIPAMKKAGIKRIVTLTGAGAKLPDEKLSFINFLNRTAISLGAKAILKDSEDHLKLLSNSQLEWTSLRSPVMTNNDSARYKLSLESPAPWELIGRHSVVLALLHVIENNPMPRKAPFITSK